MTTPNIVKRLNHILIYLHDSHKGYKECASKISNAKLKTLLIIATSQRQNMIEDIETQIKHFDEEPVHHGSMIGPAHRLYVDLKALLNHNDEHALIDEIKRGEATLIDTYKETLRTPIPSDLNYLLKTELIQIQSTLKEIDQTSH